MLAAPDQIHQQLSERWPNFFPLCSGNLSTASFIVSGNGVLRGSTSRTSIVYPRHSIDPSNVVLATPQLRPRRHLDLSHEIGLIHPGIKYRAASSEEPRRMKKLGQLFLFLVLLSLCISTACADAYDARPKLVIVVVFDQFRGDYLDRYRAEFKEKNGWNLFLKQGAHFTDCYYDYANLVTAAGHATTGTGAYTDGHEIPLNEWYESGPDGKLRQVSSVADDRYKLVGAPTGTKDLTGASAHREMASTLGDELVLATGGRARVYGVSMKDRAAILTSGHA